MASAPQLAVRGIQLNDYMTRMLVDLGASRLSILMFFPVVVLTAVGYDYSKGHMSLCVSSH